MTMKNTSLPVARCRWLAAVMVLGTILPGSSSLQAQTTADNLYLAVQKLQLALGDGAVADQTRNQFFIRQLETESARGFSANAAIFDNALTALNAADGLSPELSTLRDALAAHVDLLTLAGSSDLAGFVAALAGDLEEVSLESLAASRDDLIATLQGFDQYNEQQLSAYGRHYLSKRLGLAELVQRLEGLNFEVLDISLPDDISMPDDLDLGGGEGQSQDDLNRDLNTLRGELRTARQKFGLATSAYPNLVLAGAEKRIAGYQQQVTAYLLNQTTRALQAFREDFIQRQRVLVEDPATDRLYQAELGRLLGLLADRRQSPGIGAVARQMYSSPNLKITIEESIVNLLGGQRVSQIEHLDEVILGSRAQGWLYTSGLVSLDFINNPYSAHVRLNLNANLQTQAYTKEGPVTAYTSTAGMANANRELTANIGNISVYPVTASARINSNFHGTNCVSLVDRIAFRQFSQKQARAEEIAAERAQVRLRAEFEAETDKALGEGFEQLQTVRDRRGEFLETLNKFRREFSEIIAENEEGELTGPVDMVDPFVLPRLFVTTTDRQMNIGGTLEGDNRLAAPSFAPSPSVPAEFRVQIHESMVSNLIAPLFQDRLLQNWQFGRLAEGLSSGQTEIPKADNDRRWAIQFEDGRPIQLVFDDNEFVVTVFGKQFRQERRLFPDPLYIQIRLRVINDDGTLKLVRVGKAKADFTYPPAEGKTLDPDAIAFRQFLQDNLDEALADDPMEQAIELPANLVPMNYVDDEEMKKRLEHAQLVEFWADDGWLNLGWNYLPPQRPVGPQAMFTPAIWQELPSLPEDSSPGDNASADNPDDV